MLLLLLPSPSWSLQSVIDDLQSQLEDAHVRVEAAEEREREFQMKNMQTQAKHRATEVVCACMDVCVFVCARVGVLQTLTYL